MNPIQKNKLSHYLLVALFGLPLVFIPGNPDLTIALRLGVLIAVTVLIAGFYAKDYLFTEFMNLKKWQRYILAYIASAMLLSTVLFISPWQTKIIGRGLEYQGLIFWLCCFLVGISLRSYISKFIQTNTFLYIGATICMLSLLIGYEQTISGYRLTGLSMQSTTMGFYAAVVFAVAAWRLAHAKTRKLFGIAGGIVILALITVLLSQSRGAFYACIAALIVFTVTATIANAKTAPFFVVSVFALSLLPLIGSTVFTRFVQDNVTQSTNYRLTIYKKTFSETLSGYYLFGNGAGAIPIEINSRDEVPKDIAETLGKGYIFASSHDIWLDFSYYFGLVSGAALLVIWLTKFVQLTRAIKKYSLELAIFVVVGANALINVPSIELTVLFFIFLFIAVGAKTKKYTH